MAALTRSGQVYTLGECANGELGHGGRKTATEVTLVSSLVGRVVVQVCCASSHTLALTQLGDVYAWGRGFEGQLGLGEIEVSNAPRFVSALREACVQVRVFQRELSPSFT